MDLKEWTQVEIGKLLGLPVEESKTLVSYLESMKDKSAFSNYLLALLGDHAMGSIKLIADRWFPSNTSTPNNIPAKKVIRLVASDKHKKAKKAQKQEDKKRTICYCMGITHGLFTNCLNCGKVLCKQEEDKVCTFCSSPIGSTHSLRKNQQKQQEKQKRNVSSTYKTKLNPHIVSVDAPSVVETSDPKVVEEITASFPKLEVSSTSSHPSSSNSSNTQDTQKKKDQNEKSDLVKAQESRDRLLQYDKEDVARSRVVDAAEDFESTQSNMWLSPAERALAKKKQLEYEKQVAEEKRKVLVSIDLENQQLISEDRKDVERPDFSEISIKQFIPPTVYYEEGEIEYIAGSNQKYNQSVKIFSNKPMIVEYDNTDEQ